MRRAGAAKPLPCLQQPSISNEQNLAAAEHILLIINHMSRGVHQEIAPLLL